jgi:hypothetical protein
MRVITRIGDNVGSQFKGENHPLEIHTICDSGHGGYATGEECMSKMYSVIVGRIAGLPITHGRREEGIS